LTEWGGSKASSQQWTELSVFQQGRHADWFGQTLPIDNAGDEIVVLECFHHRLHGPDDMLKRESLLVMSSTSYEQSLDRGKLQAHERIFIHWVRGQRVLLGERETSPENMVYEVVFHEVGMALHKKGL